MSRTVAAVASLALLAGTAACGSGDDAPAADDRYGHAATGDLALTDGWATEAPKAPTSSGDATDMGSTMSAVSGAYFTLTNDGDTDDALVGVSTDAASQAQLHTTESTGGGTGGTMKQVARVPVPAGKSTRLTVGGYHVMLISPTRALSAGDEVSLRLRFASGADLDVTVPVLDRADRPS
ncbi:hypothetical protein GCM10011519_25000 [Marmoricola endophyticus]|uniref:Copper chaperone PCu(A)C n=1 Tax=Marmoricola endophyticus TaxID=2040280 RepID=A0A917BL96_9ACTN|nr:copper chaperone PCu(A)C [Marmoricola endophyticus]GGF49991.1 hypothetical protein GCM10011519_25000 [Marmoricola endophyticus]